MGIVGRREGEGAQVAGIAGRKKAPRRALVGATELLCYPFECPISHADN